MDKFWTVFVISGMIGLIIALLIWFFTLRFHKREKKKALAARAKEHLKGYR